MTLPPRALLQRLLAPSPPRRALLPSPCLLATTTLTTTKSPLPRRSPRPLSPTLSLRPRVRARERQPSLRTRTRMTLSRSRARPSTRNSRRSNLSVSVHGALSSREGITMVISHRTIENLNASMETRSMARLRNHDGEKYQNSTR
jgi:hypothetical protein